MFEVTEERRGAKVVARKPRFDRLRQLVEVIRWGDRQGKKGDQMYPKSVWVMPLACQKWRDVSQTLPTHWGWQARTKGCSTQEDWTWGATPCLQLQIISSALGTRQIFDIFDIPGILLQRVRVASVRRCQALSGHLWFPADRAVLCCPLSLAMKEKEIQLKEESKALEGPFSQNESWDEN